MQAQLDEISNLMVVANKGRTNILNKFDISDWAIKKLRTQQILREIRQILYGDFFEFMQKSSSKLIVGLGNKLPDNVGGVWTRDVGHHIGGRDQGELKTLIDRAVRPNQRKRIETALGPVRTGYRMALAGTAYTGALFGVGQAEEVFDKAIIFVADVYHKYWGSKNQCISAELEDLASYDHQADPKLFDIKIAQLAADVRVDGSNLHDVVMEAMRKDELFRLCLYNHYKLRYGEMIRSAKFFEEFDPFNPAVPERYKNIFDRFVDMLNPFDNETSDEVVQDLYEEFVVLFLKRYIYLRDAIIEDRTNQNIADTITALFERLADDPNVLHECGVVRDVDLPHCMAKNVKELPGFEDLNIGPENVRDEDAVLRIVRSSSLSDEAKDRAIESYVSLMELIESSREVVTAIIDVRENQVTKPVRRRGRRRGGDDDDRRD